MLCFHNEMTAMVGEERNDKHPHDTKLKKHKCFMLFFSKGYKSKCLDGLGLNGIESKTRWDQWARDRSADQ